METKISTKGQVVLPHRIRRRLGLQAGDVLDAELKGNSVVLTPKKGRRSRAKIVKDPDTGWPVLSVGGKFPALTSEEVSEILIEFP